MKTGVDVDFDVDVDDVADQLEKIGWIGWVAKGVVYALIGILFIAIAFGSAGGTEANQAGAIEAIAERRFGAGLLVMVGIGLLIYATWRLFTVFLPGDWTGRALLDRGGYLVSVLVYSSLVFTISEILRNRGTAPDQREDRTIESLVKSVLGAPAGQFLVAAAGIGVVVVGLVFIKKGLTRSFHSQLDCNDDIEGTIIDRLGMVGWIARGVSMLLIGVFLVRAAWLFDADEAAGLDDSIRQVADNPLGAALSVAVGLGFIAFGAFAAISARHRILEGPRNEQ